MAYTQSDLDSLNEVILAGEGEVVIQGKKIVYRSLAELLRIKQMIERDLAAALDRKAPRAYRINVSKGL